MHLGRIAAIGTPRELEDSLNQPNATLDDVFEHYGGGQIETEEPTVRQPGQGALSAASARPAAPPELEWLARAWRGSSTRH